jgi:hypothetical protein
LQDDKNFQIKLLSDDIHEMKTRLCHYRNCEVSQESLVSLEEAIKEKQLKIIELIEEVKNE